MTKKLDNTVYLKDYQAPNFAITSCRLDIDLEEERCQVISNLELEKSQKNITNKNNTLILNGEGLELKSIRLNKQDLSKSDYKFSADNQQLIITDFPNQVNLEIITEIYPHKNTALSGLYKSGNMFCTQCEAEGFRRITYFPDRPDVMTKFTTCITADKNKYPVLLSNGNLIETGDLSESESGVGNRHYVKWLDPFKKPSYLFAMVAGDLIAVEDHFLTKSKRLVTIKLYVERENLNKTGHALAALKKAMAWDEVAYGREYDLDIYMIVAVNDFNMGAMENKGLNIFNSKYVLANPETATDTDYEAIDAIIGHEYFHNWSGNRVTCRDWFQLSLKEGFTVFREQQFSDYVTRSISGRINQVRLLRTRQFAEDASPMAHPVRPESYQEINNFYTLTVYEKGSEVIRMISTILGSKSFRAGCDLYFKRHDGQAVTIDDFVVAMQDASGIDLSQFKLWYSQEGTPEISIEENYDVKQKKYIITLSQFNKFNKINNKPMYIPIAVGLLNSAGKDILKEKTKVLFLQDKEQSFEFNNISTKPILSILRGFSAPIKIKSNLTEDELAVLIANDSDDFNRWDACQSLMQKILFKYISQIQQNNNLILEQKHIEIFKNILIDSSLNLDLKAELLILPTSSMLIEAMQVADPDAIFIAREFLFNNLAQEFNDLWLEYYQQNKLIGRYKYNQEDCAARKFKNICLQYLARSRSNMQILIEQYNSANNMTDLMAVLGAVTNIDCTERKDLLAKFYQQWQHEPLVVNKWLAVQAYSELPLALDQVKKLSEHSAFDLRNPNKVYALFGGFASGNPIRFHDKSGAGYEFLADKILELDVLNPQVAARMVSPFTQWKKFDQIRQDKLKQQLLRMQQQLNLSKNVAEIVNKCLQ